MIDNFIIRLAKLRQKFSEGKRSNRWRAVRSSHLHNFPTCAACGGKEKIEVHHIKPFHLQPELELSYDNLITLCESTSQCHYDIGHHRDWKGFNAEVVADSAKQLASSLNVR